jgi:hypothetical protein
MPNRAISKRLAAVQIISIAQHARPKTIGHIDELRPQLYILSNDVIVTDDCSSLGTGISGFDNSLFISGNTPHIIFYRLSFPLWAFHHFCQSIDLRPYD